MNPAPKPVMGKLRTVGRTIVAVENNWVVATTYDCDFTAEQQEANAFELARRANCHTELVEALRELMECSPCQNGCKPDDMTCASNKARATLAHATP